MAWTKALYNTGQRVKHTYTVYIELNGGMSQAGRGQARSLGGWGKEGEQQEGWREGGREQGDGGISREQGEVGREGERGSDDAMQAESVSGGREG